MAFCSLIQGGSDIIKRSMSMWYLQKNAEAYDWSRFNNNSFFNDFFLTNWNSVMDIEKNEVKRSFNKSVSKVNSLIMLYVPMEKLNK